MSKTPAMIVGNDRTLEIAAQIRAAMSPILDADATKAANKEEATRLNDEGNEGAVNARELILGSLAATAANNAWTTPEINMGAILMAKGQNALELPKSISTFIGECKLAMHPEVRDGFTGIVAMRNLVWEAEEAAKTADKGAPQPVKKFAKRKYHLLRTIMSEGIKGNWLASPEEIVDFCERRDPDLNAKTAFKQFEKLRAEVQKIANNFPDGDLIAALDTLNKVFQPHLEAARKDFLGETETETTTVVATPNANPATAAARKAAALQAARALLAAEGEEASPTVVPETTGDDVLDSVLENAA